MPARTAGLACCRGRHALKVAAAGQARKYPVSHVAGTVLDGFRISSCKIRKLLSAGPHHGRRAPAVWLTNREWSVVLRSDVAVRWSDIYSESELPAANNEHLGPLHA